MEWVLNFRSDLATIIFKGFTALGDEPFILVFLPALYWWSSGKEKMSRLGIIVLFTIILNGFLKGIFQVPRPEIIPWLVQADGYSFPSGHAQSSTVLWGYLALISRKPIMVWISGILIMGIALSRVYLGVHTPLDISMGIVIGTATIAGYEFLRNIKIAGWTALGSMRQSIVIAVILLGVFMVAPEIDETVIKGGGTFIGFLLGISFIKEKFTHLFEEKKIPILKNIIFLIIGLVVVIAIKIGVKMGFHAVGYETEFANFIRYSLIGIWVSFGLPQLREVIKF